MGLLWRNRPFTRPIFPRVAKNGLGTRLVMLIVDTCSVHISCSFWPLFAAIWNWKALKPVSTPWWRGAKKTVRDLFVEFWSVTLKMTPGLSTWEAALHRRRLQQKDEGDFSDQQCLEDVTVGRFGCNKAWSKFAHQIPEPHSLRIMYEITKRKKNFK